MATKKRSTNKKSTPKKGGQSYFSILVQFFKSERGQFLIGVCIVFVAVYMLLGMISFFFTGAIDQSRIENKSFWELISHKPDIKNWTGVGGAFLANKLMNGFMGIFALVIPVYIALVGLKLMKVRFYSLIQSFLMCAFLLIWGSITLAFLQDQVYNKQMGESSFLLWGGSHGYAIEKILQNTLGIPGVILVLVLLMVIFIVITKNASVQFFRNVFRSPLKLKNLKKEEPTKPEVEEDEEDEEELPEKEKKESAFSRILALFKTEKKEVDETKNNDDVVGNPYTTDEIIDTSTRQPILSKPKSKPIQVDDDFEVVVPKSEEAYATNSDNRSSTNKVVSDNAFAEDNQDDLIAEGEEFEEYDPTKDLSSYQAPQLSLLKEYDTSGQGVDMEEQRANKEKIINTLRNYGIEITSIKATVGPTITLYEIVPQAGVRISKIRNLEDDIALSLSALGIRIIAPIPGKGTIGIEVPNKDPQIVSMQSVIASKRFQDCTYDLPVALGKTITNEIFMFDLCKMPHLLVAGATGQGKSVGLNAIITSLLYKKHPAEMKMVLVDPKMVEFNIYSRIEKHYLAKLPDAEKAIITDVTKVTQTLNSLTKEMDDRYELLMAASVRTIKEYNEKFRKRRLNPLKGHRFLPYIVIVIDEFGDLIMTAGKEIEMPIARIAQKARAVGMHMIIATQRPTTNIITGTIKANFPARMAFRVTSQIDSRTILDMAGANQLIGRGDMLFSQGSDLVRIQCAFVDTPEVEGIAQFIGSQQGYSEAFALPEYVSDMGEDKMSGMDLNDKDSLFEEAAKLIVVHQQGSTSLIQRKFSIGYNRAGRLMDQLEAAGIVGPTQGSKPRDVLIADEYSLEQKLNSFR